MVNTLRNLLFWGLGVTSAQTGWVRDGYFTHLMLCVMLRELIITCNIKHLMVIWR